MHNQPLSRRRLGDIEAAIVRASAYAETQGVPLTAERLAAEMDMDLALFRRIVEGDGARDSRITRQKRAAIQRAYGQATASVMEHAMGRGSSANMHMLYLKNNAGYGETDKSVKSCQVADTPPVIFMGEESIQD